MSVSEMTASPALASALRRLYFIRFAFAVVWAALLALTGGSAGAFLTILLVLYPLFDAAAVLWQLRSARDSQRAAASQWINIVVSIIVAVALGWASTISGSAALVVWGLWAIGAGIPQLVTAIRNRRSGGQIPQMLSGGISVFAGAAFLTQGFQDSGTIIGVAGYALLGAIFFLISAIRLSIVLRTRASA